MNRQHYQTTRPARELFKGIALAIALGVVAAMLIDSWWFT